MRADRAWRLLLNTLGRSGGAVETVRAGQTQRRWRRLEKVSARVTSLMDFNIDRGSTLKLCHERILDCAAWRSGEERGADERKRP